ncbi:hypothetical protein JKF63_03770 [Porcisia hertigi]|uniref:CRAL-TRIO domain-containing protein n=1 Tax=Porcisia hertigi TaxID=2761500 RepID=A0A836HQW6_9TRYP|nr:hypothetical protein JKF63_03770 [Porcisia hertigi]
MSNAPVLLSIGLDAVAHQAEVDEVKRRMAIHHNYFDCWIYGFLENKNYNIDDAVAKLRRRAEFEREQLATYNVTDWMMESMRKGIIQIIGNDKAGRVTFYVSTARDKPSAARREESRMNFDMFVSYGTRLRPENQRCQIAMLINQEKASMMTNLDMTLQADIALRIARFYPGCVDKIYICKMGRLLAALAKPIFSRLPAIVSDRIKIISDSDIRSGKLLELFDADVLPVELGGKNDCDRQENYDRFAIDIRDYFQQLKQAIIRGEGVKEWELNSLRSAGYLDQQSQMAALKHSIMEPSASQYEQPLGSSYKIGGPPSFITNDTITVRSLAPHTPVCQVFDIDDDANLITFGTDSVELRASWSRGLAQRNNSSLLRSPQRDLFIDYVTQFITIESFFRLNLAEMHEREWLQIVQLEIKDRCTLRREWNVMQGDKLLAGLPPSMLQIAKGFLWLCLMVTSFFFLVGTCFIVVLGVITLINIFFAMFLSPFNVFPYGAAFVVVMSQFVIFCSRGFDVARSMFQGRVVQALKAFGGKALLFQLAISVSCSSACFILFCVMATRYNVLIGLQYSLAYGWIVAVCLIFMHHLIFAFGFRSFNQRSYVHGSRQNNAETTLYLLMEVEMGEDHIKERCPPAEVIMLTVMGVLSVAMGVAFIVGGGLFFLCAAVVAQAVLLLLCAVFTAARNVGSSSDIVISCAFYASVFWMNTLFTLTKKGWSGDGSGAMLSVLFIMTFFLITGMVTVYGPWSGVVRRWLFRISWLLLLLHLLGCVVALTVLNYRLGLLVLALAVHLVLCILRTNESFNSLGLFSMSVSFTLALLACCLIGHFSLTDVYEGSVSEQLLPNYASRFNTAAISRCPTTTNRTPSEPLIGGANVLVSASVQRAHRDAMPPLCLMQFSPTLDVSGMALFAKLGLNKDVAAQEADLNRWFPSFKRVPIPKVGASAPIHLDAFREETATVSTTVVTARPGDDLIALIESMTMWIDAYAFSFLSFLMPASYADCVLPYLTFVEGMVPLRWKHSLEDTAVVVRELLAGLDGDHENVYVVGHGPVGSQAAVSGLRAQNIVRSVVFFGPPIVPSKFDLGVNAEAMAQRVLSVQTMQTVFSTWYLRIASTQFIPCSLGDMPCDCMDTTIERLDELCRH